MRVAIGQLKRKKMLKVKCKGCNQILTANNETQQCVCGKIWVEPIEENENFRCGWVTEGTTFHDNIELLNEDGSEFVVPAKEENENK